MHFSWVVRLAVLTVCYGIAGSASAELKLPAVFSDHAVFQRDVPVAVWGWAEPGTEVTINFKSQQHNTQADRDGRWEVSLDALTASAEPAEMTVAAGDHTLAIKDILVGEVWLCSGQSNMEWTVSRVDRAEETIARAGEYPLIRHIKPPRRPSTVAMDDIETAWEVSDPETVARWTAVGYHFALALHEELGVPIGLLNVSWGGTRIEPWTSAAGFAAIDSLKPIYDSLQARDPATDAYAARAAEHLQEVEDWLASSRSARAAGQAIEAAPPFPAEITPFTSHQSPAMLYRGMLHPFIPYTLRGTLWYQGESNRADGQAYVDKTKALVYGWRQAWDRPDLPYYYVQIAPFHYNQDNPHVLAEFWQAQADIESAIPHTGMVVTNDIGDPADIHPTNKHDVGQRLAQLALHDTYGQTERLARGPKLADMSTDGATARLTFDHVGGGLTTRDGKAPDFFELAGANQPWTTATAEIVSSDTVELTAPGVEEPVAVRFAWHKLASPNLINSTGLPTSAFRHGTPPDLGPLAMQVPGSGQYTPVYEIDLHRIGKTFTYNVDRSDKIQAFDRIAYFVELGRAGQPTQWVFVSMDAFTDNPKLIGIPTADSGAFFQQPVTGVRVTSNVRGVSNGEGLAGNLEFWPQNYGKANGASVPKAERRAYDHGDQPSADGDYGSMQVHLPDQAQTLFALNGWKRGANADLGIGNQPEGEPDWTFARNGESYEVKKLTVLVRPTQP